MLTKIDALELLDLIDADEIISDDQCSPSMQHACKKLKDIAAGKAIGWLNRTDIDRLLSHTRKVWDEAPIAPTTYEDLPSLLSVLTGDVSRLVRDAREGGEEIDRRDVAKELGNFVLSCIRWANELGLDPWACIMAASTAQSAYVRRLLAEPKVRDA
jgi:hypothetical protein